jgi:hypothetical protein
MLNIGVKSSDNVSEKAEYLVYKIVDPTTRRPLFIGSGRVVDVVAMQKSIDEGVKLPPAEGLAHALAGSAPLLAYDALRGHYGLWETIAYLFGAQFDDEPFMDDDEDEELALRSAPNRRQREQIN